MSTIGAINHKLGKARLHTYSNYISLGYFCEVAQDLEVLGLRNTSSPFDWGISSFKGVIKAISSGFDDFLDKDSLLQSERDRRHYLDPKYDYFSFHDFSQYQSLDSQYDFVRDKYYRRIARFLDNIKEPTLFFRYISSEKTSSNNKSLELTWIEENEDYIASVLRNPCSLNDLILIGNEDTISDTVKIYHVATDEGDHVSRKPIRNSGELMPVVCQLDIRGRLENVERYRLKEQERNRLPNRIKTAATKRVKKLLLRQYIHPRTYNIPEK